MSYLAQRSVVMNRKDRRAVKFGHWSPYRCIYDPRHYLNYGGIDSEIEHAFWRNEDQDSSRYLLWEFTH